MEDLELQLGPQLDVPISPRAGDVTERGSAQGRGRIVEVGVVEQAKRLEAELEFEALVDRKILEQRDIERLRTRTVQQVAAGAPIGEVGGRNGIQILHRESGGVDASHQMAAATVVAGR